MARIVYAIDDQPGSPTATWEDGRLTGDPAAITALQAHTGLPIRIYPNGGPTREAGTGDVVQAWATLRTWGFHLISVSGLPDGFYKVPDGMIP
jgi:hypothetical protein